jgi:quercetin dioxygenase-like cupin family protein
MSTLTRPLDGPLLTFDISRIASELRTEEGYQRSGRAGRTLAKSGRLRVVMVAMDQGNVIAMHRADSPLTIQVVEGGIEFRASGTTHRLEPGVLLYFGPGDADDIRALQPTLLVVTISAEGDDFNPEL